MRTVKTAAELKALALRRGASVAIGGQRFNSEGAKVRPAPKPAPELPAAPAAKAPDMGDVLAKLIEGQERIARTLMEGQERMAERLAEHNGGRTGAPPGLLQDDSRGLSQWLASQPDAPMRAREAAADIAAARKPVAGWEMTAERDADGALVRVVATSDEAEPQTVTFTVERDRTGLFLKLRAESGTA